MRGPLRSFSYQVSNLVHQQVRPNIIRCGCAAGTVEHAWLPPLCEGGYVSMSVPSGICLIFSRHVGCLVTTCGRQLWRDVQPGCISIAGPDAIYWRAVREPADVVEVVATAPVRRAIAEEMRVAHAADLADVHGGSDWAVWAIAARLRSQLRQTPQTMCLEYEELIWKIYRHVFATHFGGRPAGKGAGKLGRRRLDRVTDYIDAHLMDTTLSVGALAEVAALSPFHFLRTFKRTLHMTPHTFVRARRLDRVRVAIASGDDPVTAARRFGFTHVPHFRSEYSRHHGLAPGEELADVLRLPA